MDIISIIIMVVAVLVVGGIVYYYTKKVTIEQATAEAQQAIQKAVTDERIAAEAAQKAAITKSLEDAKVAADAAQTAVVSKAVADQKIADLAECQARVSKELADQKVKLDNECKTALNKALADSKTAADAAQKAAISKTQTDIAEAAFAAQKAAVSKAIAETLASSLLNQQAAVTKAINDTQLAADLKCKTEITKAIDNYDPRLVVCSPSSPLTYECFVNIFINKVYKNPSYDMLPYEVKEFTKKFITSPKKDILNDAMFKREQQMGTNVGKFSEEIDKDIKKILDEIPCNENDELSYVCFMRIISKVSQDKQFMSSIPESERNEILRALNSSQEQFMKDISRNFKKVGELTKSLMELRNKALASSSSSTPAPSTPAPSTPAPSTPAPWSQKSYGPQNLGHIRYNNLYRIMTSRLNLQP